MDTKLLIQELLGMKYETSSPIVQNRVNEIYSEVFNRKVDISCSCPDKWQDAIIETILYLRNMEQDYILRRGKLLSFEFGSQKFYTFNDPELTDEVAEEYLAKHPEDIGFFSKYPSDWKERIERREKGETADIPSAMIEMLESGKDESEIKNAFRDKLYEGKRLTNRSIAAYLREAKKKNEE